ncbi:LEF-8 [Penaeus vannamei nudivirus]|nr:LEF-8 [Penaeus vannamei nucleopolyhedrovirus]
MDQLCALTNVLEFNHLFSDCIIHNCPCYEKYKNFNKLVINNDSYLCCIVVNDSNFCKTQHLKIPIMFGSFIDYSIRGENMTNVNQFGCLYLDGCVKLIYNFTSNNLGAGHVYYDRRKGSEVYNVNIKDGEFMLRMTYNPQKQKDGEDGLDVTVTDLHYEKCVRLQERLNEIDKNMKDEEVFKNVHHDKSHKRKQNKMSRNKTKLVKAMEGQDVSTAIDKSEMVNWVKFLNTQAKKDMGEYDASIFSDATEEEYLSFFTSAVEKAPKLDHIANKVGRTCAYILKSALNYTINYCASVNDFKSLPCKLTSTFKNGNMYVTLSKTSKDLYQSKLMTNYKCIYQLVEAQKLSNAAAFTSCVKRSANERVKNSQALMFSEDGLHFTCFIDSREMKGAGENVMLSQLVIIPIPTPLKDVLEYLTKYREFLAIGDKPLRVVINSLLQPFHVDWSKLIYLKNEFQILNLLVYNDFLIINTNGYIQMKYSIKYDFFVNSFEYAHIWPDAFDDYHPHLMYNSCALYIPETAELGLPAKLTVANANIRGRCAEITNLTELVIFLHINGASNAAIIHRIEKDDKIIIVSFDGKMPKDYKIKVPINLKNPQMRYKNIGFIKQVDVHEIPPQVQRIFDNFQPIEDTSEAYGLSLSDIIMNPKRTTDRIQKILLKFYTNETRLEFVDIERRPSKVIKTDTPYTYLAEDNSKEQLFHSRNQSLRCYIRKNTDKIDRYNEMIKFDTEKKHPPHMYIYVAFGDYHGGTNEDGIIIDKKLVELGPKKLISQTLKITYFNTNKQTNKNQQILIKYVKNHSVVGNVLTFGVIHSNVPLSFTKTKNTKIKKVTIAPTYHYYITVENIPGFSKYITSTFSEKDSSINIHYSYLVPIGVGTKISTGHGQKGVISEVADLSMIEGYTSTGKVVHPLVLISPTSVLGRTMSNQVMSMFLQPERAFTASGALLSLHGFHIHHLDPSNKTRLSDNKNDLMTTENGFLANNLAYTMKMLTSQKRITNGNHQLHYVSQLMKLQGACIKLLSFDMDIVNQSM